MPKKFKSITKHYNAFSKTKTKRVDRLKNHPLLIPVCIFLVLFFSTIVAFIGFSGTTVGADDSRIVTVTDNGVTQTVPTRAKSVGDLLTRLDIQIDPADIVEPSVDTAMYDTSFAINIYRARPVEVIDTNVTKTLLSAYQEPRTIAEKAGVSLYPEDTATLERSDEPDADGFLGQKVVIDRSVPVFINLYGTAVSLRTRADTVGDVLKEKNIQSASGDSVQPSLATKLVPNTLIFVVPQGKQIASEEVAIPFAKESVDDPNLAFGQTEVRQPGTPGKKIVTYEISADGQERKPLQEVIIQSPINRIEVHGKKPNLGSVGAEKAALMAAAGIAVADYPYVDNIISHESNWRPAARNARNCIGLGQRCPSGGSNALAIACPDWEVNPVCQLQHFSAYAGRHGGWKGSYDFWQVNHWW